MLVARRHLLFVRRPLAGDDHSLHIAHEVEEAEQFSRPARTMPNTAQILRLQVSRRPCGIARGITGCGGCGRWGARAPARPSATPSSSSRLIARRTPADGNATCRSDPGVTSQLRRGYDCSRLWTGAQGSARNAHSQARSEACSACAMVTTRERAVGFGSDASAVQSAPLATHPYHKARAFIVPPCPGGPMNAGHDGRDGTCAHWASLRS